MVIWRRHNYADAFTARTTDRFLDVHLAWVTCHVGAKLLCALGEHEGTRGKVKVPREESLHFIK